MSKQFYTPIDMGKLQILNVAFQNLTSAPVSPVVGQVYQDTTNNAVYVWSGTAWRPTDAAKLTDGSIQLSALATNPLARANHTGTQLSSTISDLATTVKAYTLNSFAQPNGNISMGSYKITGLGSPSVSGDAAEYSWVIGQIQSAAAGISSKPPVRLVATSTISLSGLLTIDGVTTVAGDRVLVVGQGGSPGAANSANGVYTVASGSWTRTTIDGGGNGEIETGALWLVTEGTSYTASQWRVSTTGAITVGTTAIAIVQFGAASSYTAGYGLTLTGNSFSLNLWSVALTASYTGAGLVSSASGVKIDNTVVALKYTTTIGDGASSSFNVSHGLGTQNVVVFVRQSATPFGQIECDVTVPSSSQVTVAFAAPPASGAYTVTVIG